MDNSAGLAGLAVTAAAQWNPFVPQVQELQFAEGLCSRSRWYFPSGYAGYAISC